jgi:hypothetical protein
MIVKASWGFTLDPSTLEVTAVESGGPCYAAKIQTGQVLLTVDDEEIGDYDQLESLLRTATPGTTHRFILHDTESNGTVMTNVTVMIQGKSMEEMNELLAQGINLVNPYAPRELFIKHRAAKRAAAVRAKAEQIGLGVSPTPAGRPPKPSRSTDIVNRSAPRSGLQSASENSFGRSLMASTVKKPSSPTRAGTSPGGARTKKSTGRKLLGSTMTDSYQAQYSDPKRPQQMQVDDALLNDLTTQANCIDRKSPPKNSPANKRISSSPSADSIRPARVPTLNLRAGSKSSILKGSPPHASPSKNVKSAPTRKRVSFDRADADD